MTEKRRAGAPGTPPPRDPEADGLEGRSIDPEVAKLAEEGPPPERPPVPGKINDRFHVGSRLGSGSFGDVHACMDNKTGKAAAIKLEPAESFEGKLGRLRYEAKVLAKLKDSKIVPRIQHFVTEGAWNAIVMEMLGASLENVRRLCGWKLSVKSVCMLAIQLLNLIEYLHAKHLLHRDIKPGNFIFGAGEKKNKLYVIDFGLSKRYRDPRTGQHYPYADDRSLTGTAVYTSINTHLGIEQSRRDDLEAMGYMLVHFVRGDLPWTGLMGKKDEKEEQYGKMVAMKKESYADKHLPIMNKKLATPVEVLCEGLPKQFAIYLTYCKNLEYDETPDYSYLRKLFRDLLTKRGHEYDHIYDWTKKLSNEKEEPATSPVAKGDKGAESSATEEVPSSAALKEVLSLSTTEELPSSGPENDDVVGDEVQSSDNNSDAASDAQDSDAKASDAEDSDAKDSDAKDSEAEDSDAKGSDAQDEDAKEGSDEKDSDANGSDASSKNGEAQEDVEKEPEKQKSGSSSSSNSSGAATKKSTEKKKRTRSSSGSSGAATKKSTEKKKRARSSSGSSRSSGDGANKTSGKRKKKEKEKMNGKLQKKKKDTKVENGKLDERHTSDEGKSLKKRKRDEERSPERDKKKIKKNEEKKDSSALKYVTKDKRQSKEREKKNARENKKSKDSRDKKEKGSEKRNRKDKREHKRDSSKKGKKRLSRSNSHKGKKKKRRKSSSSDSS